MPATFSVEGQIEQKMRELEISARNLCEIARLLNVPINTSKLSMALNDKHNKTLDEKGGTALLELLDELKTVREMFTSPLTSNSVPFDWSRWEAISTFVLAVRLKQIEKEQQALIG